MAFVPVRLFLCSFFYFSPDFDTRPFLPLHSSTYHTTRHLAAPPSTSPLSTAAEYMQSYTNTMLSPSAVVAKRFPGFLGLGLASALLPLQSGQVLVDVYMCVYRRLPVLQPNPVAFFFSLTSTRHSPCTSRYRGQCKARRMYQGNKWHILCVLHNLHASLVQGLPGLRQNPVPLTADSMRLEQQHRLLGLIRICHP